MNLYDVIKKPVITEKSMAQRKQAKYVLVTLALGFLIKQAVERRLKV